MQAVYKWYCPFRLSSLGVNNSKTKDKYTYFNLFLFPLKVSMSLKPRRMFPNLHTATQVGKFAHIMVTEWERERNGEREWKMRERLASAQHIQKMSLIIWDIFCKWHSVYVGHHCSHFLCQVKPSVPMASSGLDSCYHRHEGTLQRAVSCRDKTPF